MSHQQKKKREIFLLSKLTPRDYLLIFGIMLLLFIALVIIPPDVFDFQGTPYPVFYTAPSSVPARSIQTMSNISSLWSKEDFFVGAENLDDRFFTPGEQRLVFPVVNPSEDTYILETLDIVTGQMQWQTSIPGPATIRIYQDKLFITAREWMDHAPVRVNQELPYCGFRERYYSLSVYNVRTGQKARSYGYLGINSGELYFQGQSVFLEGTHDHGNYQMLENIDIDSGFIVQRRCNDGPIPVPPLNSGVIYGSAFHAGSIDMSDDYGCSRDYPLCFLTEGNRLHIQDWNSRKDVAFIDFEGAKLTHYYIDIVVQDNIIVLHLLDSHQLFAFRLP